VNPTTPRRYGTATLVAVDYALLEILPDEGQMLGLKPIALQVSSIKLRPEFEGFSGNQIAGRLKSLQFMGYATTQITLPLQAGIGWQRTKEGKEALQRNGRITT
jgi:hypothetical protein